MPRSCPPEYLAGTGQLALLLISIALRPAGAEELAVGDPYKIKAAFLRNFAHYIDWPKETFADATMPWSIGILGPDPFGTTLERTLAGRTEQGRPFVIHRADLPDELPPCQIVYITYADSTLRRAALRRFAKHPVLTVGDAHDFLAEGGILLLEQNGRIRMSVNLDGARAASLEIQTKLLEVAARVLKNGVLQPMR